MLLILGALLVIGWIAVVTKTQWFPYPSSLLKALGLAIPTWVGATAVFSLEVWHGIFFVCIGGCRWRIISIFYSSVCRRGFSSIPYLVSTANVSVLFSVALAVVRRPSDFALVKTPCKEARRYLWLGSIHASCFNRCGSLSAIYFLLQRVDHSNCAT